MLLLGLVDLVYKRGVAEYQRRSENVRSCRSTAA
jgi:hypothetical protein